VSIAKTSFYVQGIWSSSLSTNLSTMLEQTRPSGSYGRGPTGYTTTWSAIRSQYGSSNGVDSPSQMRSSSVINLNYNDWETFVYIHCPCNHTILVLQCHISSLSLRHFHGGRPSCRPWRVLSCILLSFVM
jgi:hypothetical protein